MEQMNGPMNGIDGPMNGIDGPMNGPNEWIDGPNCGGVNGRVSLFPPLDGYHGATPGAIS